MHPSMPAIALLHFERWEQMKKELESWAYEELIRALEREFSEDERGLQIMKDAQANISELFRELQRRKRQGFREP